MCRSFRSGTFCVLSMCKLALIQSGIEAVLRKQLLMLALLHDVSVPHDEDPVRFPDGGQAVSDDEAPVCRQRQFIGNL